MSWTLQAFTINIGPLSRRSATTTMHLRYLGSARPWMRLVDSQVDYPKSNETTHVILTRVKEQP